MKRLFASVVEPTICQGGEGTILIIDTADIPDYFLCIPPNTRDFPAFKTKSDYIYFTVEDKIISYFTKFSSEGHKNIRLPEFNYFHCLKGMLARLFKCDFLYLESILKRMLVEIWFILYLFI